MWKFRLPSPCAAAREPPPAHAARSRRRRRAPSGAGPVGSTAIGQTRWAHLNDDARLLEEVDVNGGTAEEAAGVEVQPRRAPCPGRKRSISTLRVQHPSRACKPTIEADSLRGLLRPWARADRSARSCRSAGSWRCRAPRAAGCTCGEESTSLYRLSHTTRHTKLHIIREY
jgi:hypothetical protein